MNESINRWFTPRRFRAVGPRAWGLLLMLLVSLGPPTLRADADSVQEGRVAAIDLTRSPMTLYFLGDSITHGGNYHQNLQLFLLTRYPGRDIWTVNGGYSGQTSWGILRADYLQQDVYPTKPDALFVHFGMNDVNRDQYKGKMEPPTDAQRESRRSDYRKAMTQIVDNALDHDLSVVLLSPTIYDDQHTLHENAGDRPHLNAELKYFGDMAKDLAASKEGVGFIDLHTPLNTTNQRLLAENSKNTLIGDRVHPRRGGEEVMVHAILKELGVRSTVYDIAINAAGTVIHAEGASATEVNPDADGLSFTLTETALPFPTERASKDFANVAFDADLNVMRLTVTGLQAGEFQLEIDSNAVGTFTSEQWAEGIDLATNESTPQYQRALALLEQTRTKLRYELAIANMRALRNNLRDAKDADGQPLDWAWDKLDPDQALDAANREYDRLAAEGKKPSGWKSYVFNEGRKGFAQYDQIMPGLESLRQQWAELPTETVHRYRISPTP